MEVGAVLAAPVAVEQGDGDQLVEDAVRVLLWCGRRGDGGGDGGVVVGVEVGVLGEIEADAAVALALQLDTVLAHRLLFVTLHVAVSAGQAPQPGPRPLHQRVEPLLRHTRGQVTRIRRRWSRTGPHADEDGGDNGSTVVRRVVKKNCWRAPIYFFARAPLWGGSLPPPLGVTREAAMRAPVARKYPHG